MTSVQENEPDSTVYESRISYLMLLEDKQRALSKKALLHRQHICEETHMQSVDRCACNNNARLICISKITPLVSDKRVIGAYYDELFKNLQVEHQAEAVSGILLIYPGYVVHLVEASSDIIYKVLRDIDGEECSGLISDTKILTINHDIPSRLYQQWTFRILNISSGREEFEGKEGITELVIDAITSLLKLGMFILKSPKLNVKNSAESLHETVPELLIPQDQLGHMLKSDQLESPSSFLQDFDQPLDAVLDSELVWPLAENIVLSIK